MLRISTILLALSALVLTGLAVMQARLGHLELLFGAPPLNEGQTLYNFQYEDVGSITLTNGDGAKVIVKKHGANWKTTSPWQDLADTRVIRSLVDFSRTLIIKDVRKLKDFDTPADVGLEKKALQINIHDTGGRPLAHYSIGSNTTWRHLDPDTKNLYPTLFIQPHEKKLKDHIYICTDIADEKIRPVGIRTILEGDFVLLRDHRAFYYSPTASAAEIQITDGKTDILLRRPTPTPGSWKIVRPLNLAADEKAVRHLLQSLSQLNAVHLLHPSLTSLPEPKPENIARTITLRFFQPDGSVIEKPTILRIFPPKNDEEKTTLATVSGRDAILTLPLNTQNNPLKLPTDLNYLRNKTLSSLNSENFQTLQLADAYGKAIQLTNEWDPHERASRWQTNSSAYQGPANEKQRQELFVALTQYPILKFTDDAATDLTQYNLHQPELNIHLTLKNPQAEETESSSTSKATHIQYAISKKNRLHYYLMRPGGKRIIELTKKEHEQLLETKTTDKIKILDQVVPENTPHPDLNEYALDQRATKLTLKDGSRLLIGSRAFPHYYANRKGSTRVTEITPAHYHLLHSLDSWHWKQLKPWNIDPTETRGLIIQRGNQPPLTLRYDFYAQKWNASQNNQDITNKLNTNRANKYLEFLENLKVNSWLGPHSPQATERLLSPNFTLTILSEEFNADGTLKQIKPLILKIAQINPNTNNTLFFASLSNHKDYFLLDLPTVQRLAGTLLE